MSDREKSRKFLSNPMNWPRWPVCPMKRCDDDWRNKHFCALKMAEERNRLYFTNLYWLKADAKTWGEALAGIEYKDYPSLDALLDEYTVD